jgi:DNA-binding GntR family transcriptional regulator
MADLCRTQETQHTPPPDQQITMPPQIPSAEFQRLEHPTLVDAVEAQLRDRILSGQMPAGSAIRETVIAEQLGVSRAPVREALRRLEQSELVAKPRNRSYVVRLFSDRDVRELAVLRSALECVAAREAMRDPALLEARLTERLADIVDAVATNDAVVVLAADRRLHDEIIALADNRRLAAVYATLRDQIALSLLARKAAMGEGHGALDNAGRWHEVLLRPVAAGDVEGFVRLLDLHIRAGAGLVSEAEALADGPAG